jgi:hypothetical protein
MPLVALAGFKISTGRKGHGMYKLSDSEIRFLLKQDRITKLEGIALLTGGYQERSSILGQFVALGIKVQAFGDVVERKQRLPKKQENILIYQKILEIDETINRSLGLTLKPVEDILDLSVIGSDDPTFETWHFLEWADLKGFVPPSLSNDLQPFFDNQDKRVNQAQETAAATQNAQIKVEQKVKTQPNARKDIDYSKKDKSELKELVNRWIEGGMTRFDVAQKLYPNEVETVSKETLKKRVDRLREYPKMDL